MCEVSKQYMKLKIYVDNDNDLKEYYKKAVKDHNNKRINQEFVDAGFDLLVPPTNVYKFTKNTVNKIDFRIKCSATLNNMPTGFYLYPRSSIIKTPLRLANSVGIIDSGYRGNIIGAFDYLESINEYSLNPYDRLLQICSPTLCAIDVELVDTIEELGSKTDRGINGFGSTGK
jgi:dUTP pyrophosphatase